MLNYDGHINAGDKVCFSCYKSYLEFLQESKSISKDSDLEGLLHMFKHSSISVNDISAMKQLLNAA